MEIADHGMPPVRSHCRSHARLECAYYLKTPLNETLLTRTIIVAFLTAIGAPESVDQTATSAAQRRPWPRVDRAMAVLRLPLDALHDGTGRSTGQPPLEEIERSAKRAPFPTADSGS